MKNKVFALILIALMFVAIAGCGPSDTSVSEPVSDGPSFSPEPSQLASEEPSVPNSTEEPGETSTPFDRFKRALDNSEYSYEVVPMAAELVGASVGEKYKFDFGTVELYQFDENSEAFSKAKENDGLTLEGFGVFPCRFNGNLAAIIDVAENEDALTDMFDSL